jgi:hypothetical protein
VTEPHQDEATAFTIGMPWPWEENLVEEPGFGWIPDVNMLLLVTDGVTEQMIEDLKGPVDVWLLAHGPLVGLMVRFSGGWEYSETLVWREPGHGVPDSLRPGHGGDLGHLWFTVVLVDSTTKRVAHMRGFTVSPHFTKMLQRECADRWAAGVTNDEGIGARMAFNQKYPTIQSAVKASLARSRGGD